MCIIIYKPAGATLPLSAVLRSYQRNDDGWGIAAITPKGVVIRRDFGRDADETLLDAFDELRDYEMVLHCRIGTAGKLSIENTHPFNVVGDLWMFHNGTFDIDRSAAPDLCDSYHAARSIADALGDDAAAALRDQEYQQTLGAWAKQSKLVFVDSAGVIIVNESKGFWEGGCWFSNDSSSKDYVPFGSASLALRDTTGDMLEDTDDLTEQRDEYFSGRYYDGITPRCFRVETQDDEDRLYLDTLAFIDALKKLDVDDIAEHCLSEPEMAAEALHLLVNSRISESVFL